MSEDKKPEPNIQGEALELDILLDFADIGIADVESASEWWDEHASPDWVGALDKKPVNE